MLTSNDFGVDSKLVLRLTFDSSTPVDFQGVDFSFPDTPIQIRRQGSRIIEGNILESYIYNRSS